ncbi:hypothetical protein ACFFIO_12400 [Citricoccus parietis]|uniref:Nucleotide exchange factor GrpE n=1 Tax=Citricoccus parietis TaxID=592307 RepID=A0ABV6F6Z7_9MICC
MSKQTPEEPTRSAPDPDAGRSPDNAEGGTEEWTGGHQEQSPPRQDAEAADLPELEVEEGSVVRPENS